MKAILVAWAIVVGAGLAGGTARADDRLRIVTFNVQCLAAPGTRASRIQRFRWNTARRGHLERVASVIETLDPDVINLVEVTSVEAVETLVQILHEKGLDEYRGYHVESFDSFTGFDVALITKFEPDVIDGASIRCVFSPKEEREWREDFSFRDADGDLRQLSASIRRNSLYFITVHGYKLGFLGLHLKSNPSDAYSNGLRTAESIVAQRIIRREIVGRGYLPIVLGDLNDYDPDIPDRDPNRETVTGVMANLKDYDPSFPGPELVNVTERILRQADRYSCHWDRNENGVTDSDDVLTMIDHVLIAKELMPSVRRAFVSRCTDLKTSDHWPVVVDLDLPSLP